MVEHPRRLAPSKPQRRAAPPSEGAYELCAARLKALSDPGRLRIVNRLLRGSINVTQLGNELNMAIVNVSHHLQVLRQADLLQARRRGKFVIYSLHPDVVGTTAVENTKSLDLGYYRLELFAGSS